MKAFIVWLLVVVVFPVWAIELGNKFHYEHRHKLKLQETTKEDAKSYFGEPEKVITADAGKTHFEIWEYYFIHAEFTGGDERVMLLEFKNDKLIAFVYDSSHKEDSTLFDLAKAMEVNVGDPIKEVHQEIGHSSGEALCPVNIHKYKDRCKEGDILHIWVYTPGASMFEANSVETKIMWVGINEAGNVVEVKHETVVGVDE